MKNLGQLQNKVSVINASAFFHLFDDGKQRQLARILGNLLSPQPNSIILGRQAGAPTVEKTLTLPGAQFMKLHCPKTWQELWTGNDGPFNPDDVEIHTLAHSLTIDDMMTLVNSTEDEYYWLTWSVRRV